MTALHNIRVVALLDLEIQENLVALLQPLQVQVHLLEKITDFPLVPAADGFQDVVLLPDESADRGTWDLDGILRQYTHPPAFLVYSREVSFARWAGVLDSGGIDVVTVPFQFETLQAALQLAAKGC